MGGMREEGGADQRVIMTVQEVQVRFGAPPSSLTDYRTGHHSPDDWLVNLSTQDDKDKQFFISLSCKQREGGHGGCRWRW